MGLMNAVSQLLVAAMASLSSLALAQLPPQIVVAPSPASSSDVLQITVATNQPCYPSSPGDFVTTTVTGNVIRITTRVTCATMVPPPPYTFSQSVGPLPAGTYQVEYWSSSGAGVPQRLAFVSLLITLAEAIPVLGPWSLLVLALLVLAISLLARPFDAHVARGLIVALFTLATLSHSAPAWTSDAVADEPVEQRVKRQLIVLFDPTRIDSPRAADIVSAVNAGRESAELTQLLGSPQRAKRLLDRVPAASASFLSTHDPLAPERCLRAMLCSPTLRKRLPLQLGQLCVRTSEC